MPDQSNTFLSSSMVKEIASLGGKTKDFVPECVEQKLKKQQKELKMYDLVTLIENMGNKTSDLHITVGAPPVYRRNTRIIPAGDKILDSNTCKELVYSVLSDEQRKRFEKNTELDMSFGIKGVGRIRMNVFKQRGSVAAALRLIPTRMWPLNELNLPDSVMDIVNIPKGLVLVTGETGSGKSTTLASMINHINQTRSGHIITVEDRSNIYIHTKMHNKSKRNRF